MNLIERLKYLEGKIYGADTHEAPKYVAQFQDELHEAWPKLLAVVEAAREACRSIPGMLPKIEDALAALEKK